MNLNNNEVIAELSSGKTVRAPQRYAILNQLGREPVKLPIAQEGTHGFLCYTGGAGNPATEWFAFTSDKSRCYEAR